MSIMASLIMVYSDSDEHPETVFVNRMNTRRVRWGYEFYNHLLAIAFTFNLSL